MEPYNLDKLYRSFTKISKEVVLYLPRTSDLNQIARYGQDGKKLEVAHYAMMGASKVCNTNNLQFGAISHDNLLMMAGPMCVFWRFQFRHGARRCIGYARVRAPCQSSFSYQCIYQFYSISGTTFSSHVHKSLSSAPLMPWPMPSYSLIVVFSSLMPSSDSRSQHNR